MLAGLVLSEFCQYLSIYILYGSNSSFNLGKYHAESFSPNAIISVLVFYSNKLTSPLSDQQ